MKKNNKEYCSICGCELHREKNTYARPNPKGRSHATEHHYVPERFFGRSTNRKGTQRTPIFEKCPWKLEKTTDVFCYDCHEELLHNPVLLPKDIEKLALLVKLKKYSEKGKTNSKNELAGRIKLLQEIIQKGIDKIISDEKIKFK